MKKLMLASFASFMLMAGNTAPAFAANEPITLHGAVQLEKRVVENGAERLTLEEPKVVVPNDKLLFTTTYVNTGATKVENFVVTNPLPSAVMLASEGTEDLAVSIDGGKTYGALATLMMVDAQGTKRPAQASDVTHIRWTLAVVAPGASGKLTYRAIVR